MTTSEAVGTFQITLSPHAPVAGAPADIARLHFTKTWTGDLSGESHGEMLSVGDPQSGTAAYVVLEVFQGALHGRPGRFAFQQYGTLVAGQAQLSYGVVQGSGSGDLSGLSGHLSLDREGGEHRYALRYSLETV